MPLILSMVKKRGRKPKTVVIPKWQIKALLTVYMIAVLLVLAYPFFFYFPIQTDYINNSNNSNFDRTCTIYRFGKMCCDVQYDRMEWYVDDNSTKYVFYNCDYIEYVRVPDLFLR